MKAKKILVIVDMQNDFLTGTLASEHARAAIPGVIDVVKNNEYDEVYLTRDTHGPDYLKTREGFHLPVIHTLKGSFGWHIDEDVMTAVKEKYFDDQIHVIDKNTFGSVDLMNAIKALADSLDESELQIDFVGVCTGICVISNVFGVMMAVPNAKIRVIEKACGCVSEETHKTAISAMKTLYVDIV